MSKKKPDLKQRFSSGNCVEIYITEIEPEIYDGECQWENFPPSDKDISEYQKLVPPRLERAMQKIKMQKQARLN